MGNDVTSNPWVLDSTGAVTTDLLRVKGIRWVGATTAAHAAILKDKNGKVKWSSVASGANYVESDTIYTRPGQNWDGLTVDTLGSGKLYVELL